MKFLLGASPPSRRFCVALAEDGDPMGRKSSAQITVQSTAPCPPHCGSAIAPPPYAFAVARWDFISILLTAKRVKFLFKRGGRLVNRRVLRSGRGGQLAASTPTGWNCPARAAAGYKAKRTLIKRPMGAPAGQSETALRCGCVGPNLRTVLCSRTLRSARLKLQLRSGRAGPTESLYPKPATSRPGYKKRADFPRKSARNRRCR